MGNKCWREGNIPIYGSTSFFLEDLHIQQSSRGIVGGEVGVAQSKISEIHPTAILRWRLPIQFRAVAVIIEFGHVLEGKRRYAPTLNLEHAKLPGETAAGPQFGIIHGLHQEAAWLPYAEQPRNEADQSLALHDHTLRPR